MSRDSAPNNSRQRTPTNSRPRQRTSTEPEPPLSSKLESALWHLNHQDQYRLFQHLIEKSGNVVGFRIKTSKNESQKISLFWLMKSLLKSRDRKYVSFDLDSWLDSKNDFKYFLLHTICPKFRITIKPALFKEENSKVLIRTVAERIDSQIQKENQDIILVFSGIDSRSNYFLNNLEDLWKNLVELKKNRNRSQGS